MSPLAKGRAEAVRLFKKNGGEANRQEMQYAVDYLLFFGYLGAELIKNISYEDLQKGVQVFQKMFGLKPNGQVDTKTLRAMECPRCGCPDHIDKGNAQHLKYMQLQEAVGAKRDRWNKQGLRYYIMEYVAGVKRKTQQQVIAMAFKAWDDVCGLNISAAKKSDDADVLVAAGSGPQHGFDGRGGTLAWASMPVGTDQQLIMRFDLDETWITEPTQRGIQLLNVACHEFGHLLGLQHSKKPGALMAPYYNPFVAVPQQDDDITRIQKLYGPNSNPASLQQMRQLGNTLTVELKPGQQLTVTHQ